MHIEAARQCFRPPILGGSIRVALLVGTLLTAINQGDVILAGEMPPLWKVLLTFLVPFLVASYGAYAALSAVEVD